MDQNIIYDGGIKLFDKPSIQLITSDVKKLLDEKINLFKDKNLYSSSYDEMVGVMIDHKLIETDLNCSGYYDDQSKEIAYVDGGLPTLFHEISHGIQYECGIFEKDLRLASSYINMEQQCESMNKYMYEKLFPHIKLNSSNFTAYFKKNDIDWLLNEWCVGLLENDIKI